MSSELSDLRRFNGPVEWIVDPDFTTDPGLVEGHICTQPKCGRVAVALFWREVHLVSGRKAERRWYCCDVSNHLYGRRVENGVVLVWRRLP